MNAIEEVKKKLKKYAHIKYEATNSSITIFPTNDAGFIVGLEETDSGYTVSFEGWHEIFKGAEEALNCMAFGLSESCRLKITLRGSTPQKWEVEAKENNAWVTDSETGLLIFPFWRKAVVIYKQNNLLNEKT